MNEDKITKGMIFLLCAALYGLLLFASGYEYGWSHGFKGECTYSNYCEQGYTVTLKCTNTDGSIESIETCSPNSYTTDGCGLGFKGTTELWRIDKK